MRIQVEHALTVEAARHRLGRLAATVRSQGLDVEVTDSGGWFSGRGVRGSFFVSAFDVVIDIQADDIPERALERVGATVERRLRSVLRAR